ncbi:fungal-specific transcription factor domain-containing protein [Dactylonectria estremocensis]|uniref:Fungal-specific transcription factor domain-containing protein n=1 Tax=Dactylonectria estremocensis TaxID=1079267 RepID=A0A9P9DM40_9HYPO|nr:fungal-specific transcription factor domain-containing protein [Dactylonectria estremocensis]
MPTRLIHRASFSTFSRPTMSDAADLSSRGGSGSPSPPKHGVYKPIRRIGQACIPCRRKKARCSGERPCRSCVRSSHHCIYSREQRREIGALADTLLSEAGPTESTSQRLSRVESKLDQIFQRLDQLVPHSRQPPHSSESSATAAPAYSLDESTNGAQSPSCGPPWLNRHGSVERRTDLDLVEGPFRSQDHAPKLEHLVPQQVARDVFKDYFRCADGQPYALFHEATFWRQLDQKQLPDHLLLAIMAQAVRFSTDAFFEGRKASLSALFANMAWRSIVVLYFQERAEADVNIVKTIMLLSIFDFTAGHDRHNSAWVKIGLAVRISQDLRLMLDCPTSIGVAEKEERRRVFWSVYMLDRLASCARARPPAVLEVSCHLSLPCDEQLWRMGCESKSHKLDDIVGQNATAGEHPGFPALVIALTSIVGRCAQCMMQDDNDRQRKPPWDQSSDYAAICSDLLSLEGYFEQSVDEALLSCFIDGIEIDPGLASPVVFARVLFCLSHCLLNQPFLLRRRTDRSQARAPNTFLSRALDAGLEYSRRLVNELRDAKRTGYILHGSFLGYCTVVAGGVHAMYTCSDDPIVRQDASTCLSVCRQILGDLSEYWPSCVSMSDAMDKFATCADRFGSLISPASHGQPLGGADSDLMWSLLDYSTLASAPDGFWETESYATSPATSDVSIGQLLDAVSTNSGQGLLDCSIAVDGQTYSSNHFPPFMLCDPLAQL